LLTTIFFLVLMLFYSKEIAVLMGFARPINFQILVLVITLDTLVVIPYAYLRVSNKPLKFAFFKILNIIIYAVFNVYFLLYVPFAIKNGSFVPSFIVDNFQQNPLVLYIFIANLIASLVTFLFLLPIVFKFKISFDKKLLVKMLTYGLPIMISSIAFVTNENLDKLLLTSYLGKDQMGIYAACYKLGVFMSLYIMAFKLGAEPFFFNHAKEENAKITYSKILTWFTIIGAVFLVIIVAFIDQFANLLLGKDEYFEALAIVPVILLANLFLGIYYNLSIWYKLTDKTRYGMYFSIAGAIITIVFNIVFIPVIGFMASAYATLITYSFMTIISYVYGKKYYSIPYQIKNIFFYIILSASLSYFSFLLFRGNILVSILIVILFLWVILWNEKNEIKQLFKK